MKVFLATLLLLSGICFSCKKSNALQSNSVLENKIIAAAKANHIPSLSVLIKEGDQTLVFDYKDKDRLIQKINIYGLASTTKLLCTVLIMKYAETNKIDLRAPITQYISKSELPKLAWINSIKVENLLNHTSGIADYTHNPSWIDLIQTKKTAKIFKEK